MDTIKNQLINQYLLKIKRIVNEDAYGGKVNESVLPILP